MPTLPPAAELARAVSRPFPNEPAGYRAAREALIAEEIELRRHLAAVAEQRRTLPIGGEVPEDYEFEGPDGGRVRLSEMFGPHDTLVTYFWMYGPRRARPCPMCTNLLGPLDANARDIEQNVALAIIALSPVARQLEFARERGWTALRLYSSAGNAFARDYRGLMDDGTDIAALNVFVKRDGKVRLFWAAEAGFGTEDPGKDPSLSPDLAPLWNILDLIPAGRRPDWYPSLDY
ncbi:MAG TPA: DUF899 family protein [Allosphingosinicella sp.]|jgi:predicted dithiol-disulfide oxidoreductase (DUF899 family)|nr:DUF899 family protein [Allosphingosinicella sp.]